MFAKRFFLVVVVAAMPAVSARSINHPSRAGAAGSEEGAETQDPAGSGMLDVLKRADYALEGTWWVNVNFASPPPGFGPNFTALETYGRGGGLVTSNNFPLHDAAALYTQHAWTVYQRCRLDRISIACTAKSTTGSTGHTGKLAWPLSVCFPPCSPCSPWFDPYTHSQTL